MDFRFGNQTLRGDFFDGCEKIFPTHAGINQDGNDAYFKESENQRGELEGGTDKQKRFAAAAKPDAGKTIGVLVGKRFQLPERDGVVAVILTRAAGIFHRNFVFVFFCRVGKTISDIHNRQLLTVMNPDLNKFFQFCNNFVFGIFQHIMSGILIYFNCRVRINFPPAVEKIIVKAEILPAPENQDGAVMFGKR